jgi:hypothetical protein
MPDHFPRTYPVPEWLFTNGWVGIMEKDPIPIYLPSDLFKHQLGLTKEMLSELKIDIQQTAPVFTLTRIDKNGTIDGNNLILDLLLQNTYDESNGICKFTIVLVMGTNSVISIPLCKPGCVGEIGLLLGTHYKDGKTHDLSGFGVNFSQPVKLHCETRDKQITISLNDKPVYTGELRDEIGRIVGAQIKFKGIGAVHHFNMRSGK